MRKSKECFCRFCRICFSLFLVLFVIIGIPLLLNSVLQKESPLKNVIGGSNAPLGWLHFWGSYLAAIGTFTAAAVALFSSINERRRNYIQNKINRLENEYLKTEEIIKANEELHTIYQLSAIISYYEKDRIGAEEKYLEYFNKLREVVFFRISHDNNPLYLSYLNALKSINIFYTNKSEILENELKAQREQRSLDEAMIALRDTYYNIYNDNARIELRDNLYKEGWILLTQLQNEINEHYKGLKHLSSVYGKQ